MKPHRIAAPREIARIPAAMTIAGSDPSGGAGLQADLKTFAALKVYGLSVITAVIAQNSARVSRVQAVEPGMVAAQLETIVAERMPDGLKIGALASAKVAKIVAKSVESLRLPAPVLDPVLIASSGTRLLEPAAERILRAQLIPLAAVVTPNIPEAEVLSEIEIDGMVAMRRAVQALHKLGARAVLIKGGHWPARLGDRHRSKAVDLFFDGRRYIEFAAARVPGEGAHGTGCALSAAIAAWLARGLDLETAISRAKRFMTHALNNTLMLGNGRYVLDHFA
ncbi:MAG: bifunctional hydroxymethylpyrimidine kinase/phosphomethylpyrimidine kinase [Deltaproteobacteria bacterium]|nr:bifunctional hydroxymethylpyrimidine kinase/phosphomethylpyrimidine kinase [Deltaproteobacteria bacterium]